MSRILIVVAFALFLIYIIYASLSLSPFSCEVCVEFRGQTACRTASGITREEATRTAIDNACARISSGVTDGIACSQTPPESIICKER
ncbi:MAG: hypothetical protein ACE5JX_17800 [Acidobacteriota bacterium]